jgi:hypothetical protein
MPSDDEESPPVLHQIRKQPKLAPIDNEEDVDCDSSPPIQHPLRKHAHMLEDTDSDGDQTSSDGTIIIIQPFSQHVSNYTVEWSGFFNHASSVGDLTAKLWKVHSILSSLFALAYYSSTNP